MTSAKDLKAYYAQRALEYEQVNAKPERQPELAVLRRELPRHFRDRDVLELACGTGYWTLVVAPAARSVRALDCNEEVLELARAKSPPRTTFARADAYALAEIAGNFDAGLAAFWWSHVPKSRLNEFFAGFHGRLAPGARVVLIDNVFAAGSSTPISRRDREGNTYQERRLGDGSTHEVLKNFPEPAELQEQLRSVGARELQVQFGRFYWQASYSL